MASTRWWDEMEMISSAEMLRSSEHRQFHISISYPLCASTRGKITTEKMGLYIDCQLHVQCRKSHKICTWEFLPIAITIFRFLFWRVSWLILMLNVVFPQESGSRSRCWAAQARSLSQVETGDILEVSTVERQCGHQTPSTGHWTQTRGGCVMKIANMLWPQLQSYGAKDSKMLAVWGSIVLDSFLCVLKF